MQTYTYAILEISEQTFNEIQEKLKDYALQFHKNNKYGIVIYMHGIAIAKEKG